VELLRAEAEWLAQVFQGEAAIVASWETADSDIFPALKNGLAGRPEAFVKRLRGICDCCGPVWSNTIRAWSCCDAAWRIANATRCANVLNRGEPDTDLVEALQGEGIGSSA